MSHQNTNPPGHSSWSGANPCVFPKFLFYLQIYLWESSSTIFWLKAIELVQSLGKPGNESQPVNHSAIHQRHMLVMFLEKKSLGMLLVDLVEESSSRGMQNEYEVRRIHCVPQENAAREPNGKRRTSSHTGNKAKRQSVQAKRTSIREATIDPPVHAKGPERGLNQFASLTTQTETTCMHHLFALIRMACSLGARSPARFD